jgi:hypothetical protein
MTCDIIKKTTDIRIETIIFGDADNKQTLQKSVYDNFAPSWHEDGKIKGLEGVGVNIK